MKISADLEESYPPRPSVSVDNTLLDLQNSSYPTQLHSIIAKYISGSKNKMAKLRTKKTIFQSYDKSKNQDLIFA